MSALSSTKKRVVVAMSGGVDSSVAAAYLKEQGHEVIGISLQLHDNAEKIENKFGTCCSLSDISDARRVADKIKIPFYVMDMETQFNESVIDDFVSEYLKGRTPNPCVRCNEKVKFRQLMDWALDLGADCLATGHYALTHFNEQTKEHQLLKSPNRQKDQSYFLFALKPQDIARTIFPIGHFEKEEVRDLATKYGLTHVAKKPDSQEICFVQSKSYKDFIEEKVPEEKRQAGFIVDTSGKKLREHSGVYQFTIGQRKGLGVNSLEPLFVISVDPDTREVLVGPEKHLFQSECIVEKVNWIIEEPESPQENWKAKIRYRSVESSITAIPIENQSWKVQFKVGQRAITPGQALVFYQNDRVLGGGWIEKIIPQHPV